MRILDDNITSEHQHLVFYLLDANDSLWIDLRASSNDLFIELGGHTIAYITQTRGDNS